MNSRRPLALVLGALTVALVSASGTASACDKHKGGFAKSDKNADGFVTADEVSEKRWERIRVADTDGDAKVSQAEFEQAKKDGKLGKKKKKKKSAEA